MKNERPGAFLTAIILLLAGLMAGNCFAFSSQVYSECERGNNKMKSTERDLPKFDILDFSGAFTVIVTAGEAKQKVKITADENLLPLITTSSQGNRLLIYPAKSICTENEITIEISVANLQALASSGSDNIKVSGINNQSFSLVQGGAGDIELAGHTGKFDAEISGSGDLAAQFLKSEKATLHLAGSSTVNVHATEELNVSIVGVADVNYFGNPKKIVKDIVGVGELIKMD
ncbi:MAG: DUF2807 domain-containing protein [Proteobacteria bacterium]|nr:DUF2807 domain-containing protein [Pseudomonadota bacterium]MBU1736544.1 DUF2807 domain-containing protein [Pseudomonadota bacterium]